MAIPENFKGVKGRSGRKTKLEEVTRMFEMHKEKVTSEALIELANSIGFQKLRDMADSGSSAEEIKDFVMPILLKGMTEKKDLTSKGKPLILPATLIDKNNLDATNTITGEDCDIEKEV
jgi:hypothetical protein